jgi:hypothetical protein
MQEPLEFNIFLHKLATKCQGKRLNDFWEQVVREMITLISRDEAPDRYNTHFFDSFVLDVQKEMLLKDTQQKNCHMYLQSSEMKPESPEMDY